MSRIYHILYMVNATKREEKAHKEQQRKRLQLTFGKQIK